MTIRNAQPEEFETIGKLLVEVYSQLEGFPKQAEHAQYYEKLLHVGELTENPEIELLVAVSDDNLITGAVVYIGDMQFYGSGGTAAKEKDAAGFRLLGVTANSRGAGIGKTLTQFCIDKAKSNQKRQLIIHSTQAMMTAWKMYETMGFKRSVDLDFMQESLAVYGFRLLL